MALLYCGRVRAEWGCFVNDPHNPRIYRTFKRSCTNWEEFARARKIEDMRNLTHDEALRRCDHLNAELSPAQKKRGTKFEFEQQ
jgi:hypothetical protein